MNLENEDKVLIEAALFVAGEAGLTNSELSMLLDKDVKEVKIIMQDLAHYYRSNLNIAFEIRIYDNKYKMLTKPELNNKLLRLAKIKYKNPLTKNLMEILTVIAYNGPITKKEIEKIKPGFRKIKIDEEGNNNINNESTCDYALRRLRELELIEPIILSTVTGSPYAYKITGKFLDLFGLKSLKDLPGIKKDEKPDLSSVDVE